MGHAAGIEAYFSIAAAGAQAQAETEDGAQGNMREGKVFHVFFMGDYQSILDLCRANFASSLLRLEETFTKQVYA